MGPTDNTTYKKMLLRLFYLSITIFTLTKSEDNTPHNRRRLNPSDLIQAGNLDPAETFKNFRLSSIQKANRNDPLLATLDNRDIADLYLAQRSRRAAAASSNNNEKKTRSNRLQNFNNNNLDRNNKDINKSKLTKRERKNGQKKKKKKNRNKNRRNKGGKARKNRNKNRNKNKNRNNSNIGSNNLKSKGYRGKRNYMKPSYYNSRNNRISSIEIDKRLENHQNSDIYEQNRQARLDYWKNKRIGKRGLDDTIRSSKNKSKGKMALEYNSKDHFMS